MASAQPSRDQRSLRGTRRRTGDADDPADGRRSKIAEIIKASTHPLSVTELAERLGIHANTVRFHLDALIADGQVERVLSKTVGPGRPPQMYRPRQGMHPNGPRSYRLLAEMALSVLASDPDPLGKAIHTGRAWGGFLVEQPAPAVPLTEDGAVDRLVDLLDDLGFAPTQKVSADGTRIGLHNCPFLELVENQTQQVICPLHLGLMQGAMASLGVRTTVDRLEPFVEPGLCLVHTSGDAP
jgi:predicted ArsR family transcriptional regulator